MSRIFVSALFRGDEGKACLGHWQIIMVVTDESCLYMAMKDNALSAQNYKDQSNVVGSAGTEVTNKNRTFWALLSQSEVFKTILVSINLNYFEIYFFGGPTFENFFFGSYFQDLCISGSRF